MNRRQFLSVAGVSLVATSPTLLANEAAAYEDYSPELYEELLASGEPFLLSFHASW